MKVDLLNKKIFMAYRHKDAKDYDSDILSKALKARKPRSVEEYESKEQESSENTDSSETSDLKEANKVKHVFKTRKHGDANKKEGNSKIPTVNDADTVKETISLDVEENKVSGNLNKDIYMDFVFHITHNRYFCLKCYDIYPFNFQNR